jgi:hypothetical protein
VILKVPTPDDDDRALRDDERKWARALAIGGFVGSGSAALWLGTSVVGALQLGGLAAAVGFGLGVLQKRFLCSR